MDLPLFGRALLAAGDTLFVAGPPDLVDEDESFKQFDDPQVKARLAEQAAALEGKRGGMLWAVSAKDGRRLAQQPLDSPPVFDGMAAASGRLYLATERGELHCFAPEKPESISPSD